MRTQFLKSTYVAVVAVAIVLATGASQAISQERPGQLIALIGIPSEITPVEARIEAPAMMPIDGFVFTSGTIEGTRVVVARSGVGKVNAAIVATLLMDHFSPSAVVFSGTAGAIDKNLNPGDVVIGTAVGYHDFGSITNRGLNRSPTRDPITGQIDPPFFPAGPDLLAAARRAAKIVQPSRGPRTDGPAPAIREGLIVTGDAFVSDSGARNELRGELNAAAVEMEGAAVAQVAARYKVPVIVIRSITDRADSQASGSYRQFLETASRNAADLALATVRELDKQR